MRQNAVLGRRPFSKTTQGFLVAATPSTTRQGDDGGLSAPRGIGCKTASEPSIFGLLKPAVAVLAQGCIFTQQTAGTIMCAANNIVRLG
jgi:hypothetical protein